MNIPQRLNGDLARKGYGDDEVAHIYELARFRLENGSINSAEVILKGICEVRSDYAPAWLGLAYVKILNRDFDQGLDCAKRAHKCAPESIEALLMQITCLLSLCDFNSAGTLLGEVGEMVDGGEIIDPHLLRFYKGQLARYQSEYNS